MQSSYQRQLESGFRLLSFDGKLETEYRAQSLASGLQQLRFVLLAGVLAGLAFPIMDYLHGEPGFSSAYATLRLLLVQPLLCLMLAATWLPALRPFLAATGIVVAITMFSGALFLGTVGQDLSVATSMAGLVLVTFYTYFFLGLGFWQAISTCAIQLSLFVAAGVTSQGQVDALLYGLLLLLVSNMIAATGLHTIEYNRRLNFLREGELRDKASKDSLTNIANRGAFDTYFERAWNHCAREQIPIAVALIDIDHFKQYNDHYGHQAGDRCLQAIAPLIDNASQRPLDLAARYGGEEFALLLPGCNTRRAREIVEDLRRSVIASVIEHAASPTSALLTVSAGVSSLLPVANDDGRDSLLRAADEALYRAKTEGRNRVATADESLADSRLAKVIRLADIRKKSGQG